MTERRQKKTDAGEVRIVRVRVATHRILRARAHLYFDRIWRDGYMTRSQAYVWLAKAFDLPKEKAHLSMMPRELLVDVPRRVLGLLYTLDPKRKFERV